MIADFQHWFLTEQEHFLKEFKCHFHDSQHDSAYLDLDMDAKEIMGRICLWGDGQCNVEMWDFESGAMLDWQYQEFGSWEEACLFMTSWVSRWKTTS